MEDMKYIICGKLYDGIEPEFKENWKILVKGDTIAEIGPNVEKPESAEVIDLSDATVMPGLIDAHMHMDYWDWHTIRQEVYDTSEYAKCLSILHTSQKSLSRGFTTIRHMGGITSNSFAVVDVKRAIEKGYFPGARIVCASRFICAAGSHGDLSQGFSKNPEMGEIAQGLRKSLGSGKDFFVNAVREEIKYGSDFIKIMATGGFFTPNDNPSQKQLNDEEAKAIIDMYSTEDILRCFTDRATEQVLHDFVGIEPRNFAYKPIRKMRVGQDAIAVKLHITPSETQPEVEASDGVTAKKIQNIYVYCQYITRTS